MWLSNIIFIVILLAVTFTAVKGRKLTVAGGGSGACIAIVLYMGTGFTGIVMLGAFFVLATLATAHKKAYKAVVNHHETTRRDAWQVLANGLVAGLCGLAALLLPSFRLLFEVALASALASATADTLSSELGTIYGRRFYNIITLKQDEKGRDGVVSLEGTLIGLAGSLLIALIAWYGFSLNTFAFSCIVAAGFIGNLTDSILGATAERKGYLGNNAVNFLNTLLAAVAGSLLLMIS